MLSFPKNTVLLLSIIFSLFVGCSKQAYDKKSSTSPKIIDNINLLSPEVKKDIEEKYKFPDGIFVLVRTIDKLDLAKIGSYATNAMQEESYWELVRPKGFFARWIKQDKPWSMSVYVLVSKEPNLIQIRYGERIRLEAYRAGLALGKKYSQIQRQFKDLGANLGTLNALKELSQELPSALNLPWYLHSGKMFVSVTFSEFEELVTPSDGIYSKWILRPYLKLIKVMGGFYSVWFFLLLNFLIYLSLQILFVDVFVNKFLVKTKLKTKKLCKKFISFIISIFLAVSLYAAIILLNNGRVEDYLTFQQLGISSPDQPALDLNWFADVTSFWLAALITLINFINLWITDPLSEPRIFYHFGSPDFIKKNPPYPTLFWKWRMDRIGDHTYAIYYDDYIYRPRFKILVFMLFMPMAIGLVGLFKEFCEFARNMLSKVSGVVH